MVRYRFAIGAVLATTCYDIIYLGLRFSQLGIKNDNVDSLSGTMPFPPEMLEM
jgi:hypothetical protein